MLLCLYVSLCLPRLSRSNPALHWPSYNRVYYEDLYKLAGYPENVQRFGLSKATNFPLVQKFSEGTREKLKQ